MQAPPTQHFFHSASEPTSMSTALVLKAHSKHSHHEHHHSDCHTHQQHECHSHHDAPFVPFTGVRRSFWNTRCCCQFSAVPDEIMIFHVFTFLEQRELAVISAVCKRWQFMSSDPFLWQTLDFSRLFRSAMAHTPLLHGPEMSSPPPVAPTVLPIVPPGAVPPPAGTETNIGMSEFNPDEQGPVNANVSDSVVTRLVTKYSDHLEGLKLCNSHHVSANTLLSLAPSLQKLNELHLCNLPTVSNAVVSAFAEHCPRLQRVSLFGCLNVTDAAVQTLTQSAPLIEELSLRGCIHLTDRSLIFASPLLEEINLSGCKKVTTEGIVALARRCPRLKRVNLHGVPLSDAAIENLATHCPELEALHLSSANPFGGSSGLTDASLIALARLKKLSLLNLQGSSNLTDAGLAIYARQNTVIRRINLGGCHRLTDNGLFHLVTQARQLTHLSLFQCFKLTDRVVFAMMNSLKELRHLDLHGCAGISKNIIDALIGNTLAYRQYLQHVPSDSDSDTLSESSGSSASSSPRSPHPQSDPVAAVRALLLPPTMSFTGKEVALAWPLLESLDVAGCRSIPAASLGPLRTVRQSLNVIHY